MRPLWAACLRNKTKLTVLYERQEHNTDEDFTLHGQPCLEIRFLSSGPFAVLYRTPRWQWAGWEIGNIVPGIQRSERSPLMCARFSETSQSNRVKRRKKRRRCAGTHKWGNWPLKIQTGLWPRGWGLLYIGAVLLWTNERVIPTELMWANTQARLQLLYVWVKVSRLLHLR